MLQTVTKDGMPLRQQQGDAPELQALAITPGSGRSRLKTRRRSKATSGNQHWLSKATVDALESSPEMASCATALFLQKRPAVPFFQRVRAAVMDYQTEASAAASLGFTRIRIPPAERSPRSVGSPRWAQAEAYRAVDDSSPRSPRSKSVPPPAQGGVQRAPPVQRLGERVQTDESMPGLGERVQTDDSIPEGNSTNPAVSKSARSRTAKKKATTRSARFHFGGADGDQVCQLARSCRRMDSEGTSQVSPLDWMMQQHRRGLPASGNLVVGEQITATWESGTDPNEDQRESSKEQRESSKGQLTHFQAFDLAKRMKLPAGQVTEAWRKFKRYDSSGRGRLTPQEYQLLLRSVLRERYPRVADIPRELFHRTCPRTGLPPEEKDKDVGIEEFLLWLYEHAFSEAILLTEDQQCIREQARHWGMSAALVERIQLLFETFDEDSDGHLNYFEFCDLLHKLLGGREALPEQRCSAFWREIDVNKDESVDFGEFMSWYLRYFGRSGMPSGGSAMEEFYQSQRPTPRSQWFADDLHSHRRDEKNRAR